MDEIRDFMRSPVISVGPQTSAQETAKIMAEKVISSLLVKDNDEYLGIVTKTDLVNKVLAKGLDPVETQISSVMSKPLLTRDLYIPRSEANEFMLRNKLKHLAVTQNGKVVGILTTKDLVS